MATTKPTVNPKVTQLQSEIEATLEQLKTEGSTSKIGVNDLKAPEYDLRSDYHQSGASITICFYLKNVYAKSFKYLLSADKESGATNLTVKCSFDKNLRHGSMTQELPEAPRNVKKISITLTKIEFVIEKASGIAYNLGPAVFEVKNNPLYEQILFEKSRTKKGQHQTSNEDDELFDDEYQEMPSLMANYKKDDKWFYDTYVDSEDSSLAGIDDIEWVEGNNKNELQREILPESQGGDVPDEVVENMARLKVELEKGAVKNQV